MTNPTPSTPTSTMKEAAPLARETLPCCGYRNTEAAKWNPYNHAVQCHNCGATYAPVEAQPCAVAGEARALLMRLRQWDALDIPDTDGAFWKREIDAVIAAPSAVLPPPEHAQLMKFYGVDSLAALVDAQAHHVEKLQAKLPPTPNVFAPQQVREG